MENSTGFQNGASSSYSRWIAGEIMLLIISIMTIYIFAALLYYSWRFRNKARVSGSTHEMRERYLHYSCAAVIVMAIARCVLHQIVSFTPLDENIHFCRVVMTTSRIVYNLAICLTYVHMWLRQRMFYTRRELKHLRTCTIEVIDWVVLVLIVVASTVLALIAFIPLEGTKPAFNSQNSCNVFDYSSKKFVHIYAGVAASFELALISLYLYPIMIKKIQEKKVKMDPKQATGNSYPELWSGIKRSFILTVIVIITDAIAATSIWILNRDFPQFFSTIIAINDVNLIINVICSICTFRNWRKIVFGFPVCRRYGLGNKDLARLKNPYQDNRESGLKTQDEVKNGPETNNHKDFDSISEEKKVLNQEIVP